LKDGIENKIGARNKLLATKLVSRKDVVVVK